jgi:hypothetical protein
MGEREFDIIWGSMKIRISIDASLLAEVDKYAGESGRTPTAVIETALRELLAHRRSALERAKVRLPTLPGGKLLPGVDLDDTSALLDSMDRRD